MVKIEVDGEELGRREKELLVESVSIRASWGEAMKKRLDSVKYEEYEKELKDLYSKLEG